MPINWFPGHMHKARKEIAEIMPQVDIIIELLDARIPSSSENPLVAELRGDTPSIKLLNKADLADPAVTNRWLAALEGTPGTTALALNYREDDKIAALLPLCEQLLPHRNLQKSAARALILGVPNVGKSTLINKLAGRVIARTGNEAGVTKAQQRIKLPNNVVLTDTPGFLWPKLNPPECGYRLAITGAIKETVFDYPDVALFAVEYLAQAYPERLCERYRLAEVPSSGVELLDAIGIARACVRKGGSVDLHKVSTLLINELRAGLLGPVTLETPEMVLREEEAARAAEEQKAREKAQHDRLRREKARKRRNRNQ